MYTIKSVKVKEQYIVSATFRNGVIKEYDMKTLFSVFPQFNAFINIPGLFEQVRVDAGGNGLSWNDELDLDANDIWEDGIEVGRTPIEVVDMLASELSSARERVGMTQKQLAESTGIYQSDISKIERGLANPSLSTLERLADGLGVELIIELK